MGVNLCVRVDSCDQHYRATQHMENALTTLLSVNRHPSK